MANKRIDEATGVETVGHEWDGIEELDNPMPRWWLRSFYACIVFALGYAIAYPTWPMISKGTEGVLGWTSRGQLANEINAEEARRKPRKTPTNCAGMRTENGKAGVGGGDEGIRTLETVSRLHP